MKPMYKKGGKKKAIMKEAKREKESFMVENKELEFGKTAMGMGGMMKYEYGGGEERLNRRINRKIEKRNQAAKELEGLDNEYNNFMVPKESEFLEEYIERKDKQISRLKNKKDVKYGKDKTIIAKTGGKKSMEPGGGGRFAAMVSGLKKEGKSEDSAKAIAASVGRKKYGKSRFQEMAAAGKQKKMGGKKC